MLLTRSPLSPVPKDWFSLDLHVLSAPPAFVLSQDQTLREELHFTESVMELPPARKQKTGPVPIHRGPGTMTGYYSYLTLCTASVNA